MKSFKDVARAEENREAAYIVNELIPIMVDSLTDEEIHSLYEEALSWLPFAPAATSLRVKRNATTDRGEQ